jgi:hypothetical protein
MKLSDIAELADPLAVWKAIEGDSSELVALLRSEEKLTRRTRDALADWLEGKLHPANRPRGRPTKNYEHTLLSRRLSLLEMRRGRVLAGRFDHSGALAARYGYDLTTEIGLAGWRYEIRRAFIREKGWHRKGAGSLYRSAEWLLDKIADQHEIDINTFANFLKRKKLKLKLFDPRPYNNEERVEMRRWEAAKKYRMKIGPKG